MNDRLFDLDGIPEVPLLREPPPGRGALIMDERISHDYPPEWHRCGHALMATYAKPEDFDPRWEALPMHGCPTCRGMGSVKAFVRLLADHRCERCHHPYMPKGDAKILGVEPTPYHWSPCDDRCTHGGPIRYRFGAYAWNDVGGIAEYGWNDVPGYAPTRERLQGAEVEAEWRILTVHHLDGDKANLAWWNLAALCQTCHLTVQGRVVLERVYPHPHSEWFRPHVAGYYASVYLGEQLTREQVESRMDEVLALELDPSYG